MLSLGWGLPACLIDSTVEALLASATTLISQCSPYQAVTGKIYRLQHHLLPVEITYLGLV